MKVRVTFDIGDEFRRALHYQYASDGKMASREDVISWINMVVDATAQDISHEWHTAQEEESNGKA